ncbi:unnamed protein product [Ixodes persulcatus]
MPEEILSTPTGRSVCSDDRGTLSTSQMRLEGHWNLDVVVKEEPEEACAPSTCEGSCSETADTPSSYHDHLDGGLADRVVVKKGKFVWPPCLYFGHYMLATFVGCQSTTASGLAGVQ